jgi:hypothetical protein
MTEGRVHQILAYIVVLAVSIPLVGQTPSDLSTQAESQIPQQAPEPKIRTHVSLVSTPVTVMDAKGELVYNLDAKDFQVTDNGVPQRITHLDLRRIPLSLVVLI